MIIKPTEQEAFKALWRCGVATKEQLDQHFGLRGRRLTQCDQSGLVTLHHDTVRLGDAGVEHCKREFGLVYRYRSTTRQLDHDLKLMTGYLKLPQDVRDTWKTESQLYAEYKDDPRMATLQAEIVNAGGTFSAVPDAAIMSPRDNGYVAYEAITKNYSSQSLAQKRRFAELFLCGIYTF